MTLAVAALFAEGPTTIRNVYSWRLKETERMKAIVAECTKLGATVEEFEDDYTLSGIKNEREAMLFRNDLWMLADRYNTLTSEQQT